MSDTTEYSGEPKFFTPNGQAVTFEYYEHLRDLLALEGGDSLVGAIKRMGEDAKLGAALRAAVESLSGGGALEITRWIDTSGATLVVTLAADRTLDDGVASRTLAALLRSSPPKGPQE